MIVKSLGEIMYSSNSRKSLLSICLITLIVNAIVWRSEAVGESWISGGSSQYDAAEVIDKSPSELLELRGFGSEVHFARTIDGYHINVVRVINPKIKKRELKRPVVFNHGLLESSTIWLINSRNVKPLALDKCGEISYDELAFNETRFLNGPMMLANHGYDVWLMSMRGTDWSLQHDHLNSKDPEFWNYCLDDFALVDVPTVVDYVRKKTGHPKVGYIGHSQATFSVFGLLSMRPKYADMIEPVVAVAPVAYFDHITSVCRALFLATLSATDKDKHGPFPSNAKNARFMFGEFCSSEKNSIRTSICSFMDELISGEGEKWPRGFYSHIPFHTSLKVLRQFGQLIRSKRYQMYDYGEAENLRIYGTPESPSYPIENIRSKSLCLISTKSDTLAHPTDVERFKRQLTVPIYKDIFIDRNFNHFDLITDDECQELVFAPILKVFETFERKSGTCAIEKVKDRARYRLNKFEKNLNYVSGESTPDSEADQ